MNKCNVLYVMSEYDELSRILITDTDLNTMEDIVSKFNQCKEEFKPIYKYLSNYETFKFELFKDTYKRLEDNTEWLLLCDKYRDVMEYLKHTEENFLCLLVNDYRLYIEEDVIFYN